MTDLREESNDCGLGPVMGCCLSVTSDEEDVDEVLLVTEAEAVGVGALLS